MTFLKRLGQSLIEFSQIEPNSKQLTTLMRRY